MKQEILLLEEVQYVYLGLKKKALGPSINITVKTSPASLMNF